MIDIFNKSKLNKAFTLAEVLITLSIIGVVAAVTMPVFIKKQTNRANVAKLQKTHSVLSQALLRAKEEQGDFSTWPVVNNATGTALIFSYIEPYLKIIKKCGNKSACWTTDIKSLSGEPAIYISEGGRRDSYAFVLNDAISVIIDVFSSPKSNISGLGTDISGDVVVFYVDVNGSKNPNVVGRDIFMFALANKGLVPFGYGDNSANCNPNIKATTSGYGCAFKVLQEKAINY